MRGNSNKIGAQLMKKNIPDTKDNSPLQKNTEKSCSTKEKEQKLSGYTSVFNVQNSKNVKTRKHINSQSKKNFTRVFDEDNDSEKNEELILPQILNMDEITSNQKVIVKRQRDKEDYSPKISCDAKTSKFENQKHFETPTKIHAHKIDSQKTNTNSENYHDFIRIDSSSKSPFKIKQSSVKRDSIESKIIQNISTSISSHEDKGRCQSNKMKILYELECVSKIIQRKVRQFLSKKKLERLQSARARSPDNLGKLTFGFNKSQEQTIIDFQIKSRLEKRNNLNLTSIRLDSDNASTNSVFSKRRLCVHKDNSFNQSLNSSMRSEVSVMSIDTDSIDQSSDEDLIL